MFLELNMVGYLKPVTQNDIFIAILCAKMSCVTWASRCQFHQHFCVRIFRMNVILAAFSSYMYVEKAAKMTLE